MTCLFLQFRYVDLFMLLVPSLVLDQIHYRQTVLLE